MTEQYRGDESLDDNRLTLDLVGLSDEERAEGSILMGGSDSEYVVPGDPFEYSDVGHVVFEWGDPKSEMVLNHLIDQIRVPGDDYFPPGVSTVIEDSIWLLSLQDNEFDPVKDFSGEDQYLVIPYDKARGQETLQTFLNHTPPHPQLLGKFGKYWVSFGPGTNLNENGIINPGDFDEDIFEQAEFTRKEVLFVLRSMIRKWDFENKDIAESNHFATNIAHWVLETFGHKHDGNFVMYPGTKGFPGKKLPTSLQQLVTYVWQDELAFTNDNNVRLESKHDYIENDPVIPNWDYIKTLPTHAARLAYIKSHPEIVAGIQMTKLEIIPQV